MPVGTSGSVRAVPHEKLEQMGFSLILGNAYHLYLRPGREVIEAFGGLHAFSAWSGNILTDSGGYQVFSLAPFRKLTEEGVTFRSHIDGSLHHFSPEGVARFQGTLGSDIQMTLDVCTGYGEERNQAERAEELTAAWAQRSRDTWRSLGNGYEGSLFGIVQGNFFHDLRKRSAERLVELDLPGYALGGLSVGEPFELFREFVAATAAYMPREKPLYVMGIGTPDYILSAVAAGVDMFDCVFPTRAARNGTVFTRNGRLVLKHAAHTQSADPIEEECPCAACSRYSRAYLRHLFKSNEMLGPMLATEHNLVFLQRFTSDLRASIREGRFEQFHRDFMRNYQHDTG
jgi:queuine tRNA-ribosyltransferase